MNRLLSNAVLSVGIGVFAFQVLAQNPPAAQPPKPNADPYANNADPENSNFR